ncbi:bifunctional DNA primase/polymerase [Streptomyces sp. MS2.AVA.5]|uniref:Bifunctional DNA primase/polymerase n=1 Tax=Streptomyces achmelvichensis TaxID=3134111 RepID=A0ACC6Q8K4_9ACTN
MPAGLRFIHSDSRQPAPAAPVAELSLAIAQWCARRGWPVHPLAAGHKRPAANCSECRTYPHPPSGCPCIELGRWCHSFHAATLDQSRILRWWGDHPRFGTGVACGAAGLVVIDIDAHPTEPPGRDRILSGIPIPAPVDLTGLATGFHTLAVLAELRGERSPADDDSTLRVSTPSGGLHVWYRAGDGRRWLSSVGSSATRGLAWQVDVRACGSYIVAPGTTTRYGSYTPLRGPRVPAPLPAWLADELKRTGHLQATSIPAARPAPPRARQAIAAATGGQDRVQRILGAILTPVATCGEVAEGAGFSSVLNRAAYTLGGLIAADYISSEVAEQALRETAVAARPGQERRIDQIVHSGLTAGLKRPLHVGGRRP